MKTKSLTLTCLVGAVLAAGSLDADMSSTSTTKTNGAAPVVGHKAIPLDVKFEFAKADLTLGKGGEADFQKAVQEMKNYPYAKMEVEGYTDSTGPDAVNQKLSVDRAQAVRKYFIEHYGLDAGRIAIKAFAEKKPAATNATSEGRSENRRAVAHIYRLEPNAAGPGGHNL